MLFTDDAVKESEKGVLFAKAQSLKDSGYDVQAFVIRKVNDVCSSLMRFMRNLPSKEKINVLVVNGHGHNNGIEVRPAITGSKQIWWDKNSLSTPLKCFKHLSKNAIIALNACYVGQKPFPTSFAAYLSKASKRRLFAPEEEINQGSFFDTSMILRRFKAKKPIFNSLCQPINSYMNGDIDFKSKMNFRAYKTCLQAFDKAVQLNLLQKDGLTPLLRAAQGFPESVLPLIKAGADVNATHQSGMTPLVIAILNNHPSAVQSLLAAKANVNVYFENEFTTLMLAAEFSPESVLPLIKAGADVNAFNSNGETALGIAKHFNPAVAKDLISAGAVI